MGLDFHDTKGGHEFLYGTMPAIRKALEELNKNLAEMKEDRKLLINEIKGLREELDDLRETVKPSNKDIESER